MATEFIHGMMVNNMKDYGKMVSSMEKEHIKKMVEIEKEFGKMEKELSG